MKSKSLKNKFLQKGFFRAAYEKEYKVRLALLLGIPVNKEFAYKENIKNLSSIINKIIAEQGWEIIVTTENGIETYSMPPAIVAEWQAWASGYTGEGAYESLTQGL